MSAAGPPSHTCEPSTEPFISKWSSPWTPTTRSVSLRGPAGRLEGVLNTGSPDAPFAALVCHPNPAYGGNLHNKVVYHAMKVLNSPAFGFGWPVLRFNFRGTGLSEGKHDGRAEVEDVLAALEWLNAEFHLPIFSGGFSFGSAMNLWACCGPQKISLERSSIYIPAVFALGLPTHAGGHHYHYNFLNDAPMPKLLLSGDRDSFAPAEQLKEVAAAAADPKRLELIPGADHFFTGQLELMQHALASWTKEQLP